MNLLLDGLQALGVGGNLMFAAIFAVAGFYVFRGKRYAGTVVALGGSMAVYTMVVLLVLSVAIALGWLDPRPELVKGAVDSVAGPVGKLVETVFEWLIDALVKQA